jgi:hypothetical protein
MKTKNRINNIKPLQTHLVLVHINADGGGVRNPVARGFVAPELLDFLNAFGLQSQYTAEALYKSGWEEVSR